jgi:signal transduction histidine kinase
MTVAVLAVHVIVLPMLYLAVINLVTQNNEDLFLNSVRSHARFVADDLERRGNFASDAAIIATLDSIVLSGDGVFAELRGGSRTWLSSLVSADMVGKYKEDFAFGDHEDTSYYISVPVHTPEGDYSLRLGFDETPIIALNRQAYLRSLIILSIYLAALLLLVSLIGRRVTRPIRALQLWSRKIASGQPAEQLAVDTDLTEFVALSRDLEMMRSHLIGVNRQLQSEIAMKNKTEAERQRLEQQLRHRQRLETVGTLAGGIAHELNNIMVPILLYADTAMQGLNEDSPVREDLRRVVRAATRARGVVQQVLTFSRQMGDLEVGPFNAAEVVAESLELVRASISPAIVLTVDIDESCPKLVGKRSLFGQVVVNLCTNAYQAIRNQQGSIQLSLTREVVTAEAAARFSQLRAGVYVRLRVTDSGEGMDALTLERIFEPFFTTRKVGEGTGLGLAVVHGIVSNMDGEIVVTSSVAEGATFEVYCPAFEPPTADTGKQKARQIES